MLRMTYAPRYGLAVILASSFVASARSATVRFVIAERPGQVVHGDSYLLPLSDSDYIAHARALLTAEPGALASIAVAYVAAGADGHNRDWLAPGRPAWSWHVTGFEGFYDVTAEILDGWPTFVEQDVPGWIANTGGQLGFWDYTVVAALPIPEPQAHAILAGAFVVVAAACRHVQRRRPPTLGNAPATWTQKKPSAPPRVFDARHSVPI